MVPATVRSSRILQELFAGLVVSRILLQAASPFSSKPAVAAEVQLSRREAQHVLEAWQVSSCSPYSAWRPFTDAPHLYLPALVKTRMLPQCLGGLH